VGALKDAAFAVEKVFSPIPSHRLADALKVKKSMAGWFTLAGGIIGFFAGFSLAIFTATRWGLIVGGKPVISLVPFVIVGFEFTILFAVFGNVLGFLLFADLPRFGWSRRYDDRCSGEHYAVLAACAADREQELVALFEESGGDVRQFSTDARSDS
jgi:molybdopterin-containing oxidoreductase family membrane subunit